jgi:hypothetical protein
MKLCILSVLFLIGTASAQQSLSLLNNNIAISWDSNSTHTNFRVESPLGNLGADNKVVSPSDAWLSVGLNTDRIMVKILFLIQASNFY